MSFLVDTNVLSELRRGTKADRGVRSWFELTHSHELFLSVVTLGELRRGIELKRRTNAATARAIEAWAAGLVTQFSEQLLMIDRAVADRWGHLSSTRPVDVSDGLIAATAAVHGLTLVTRNTDDFEGLGVELLNPFGH